MEDLIILGERLNHSKLGASCPMTARVDSSLAPSRKSTPPVWKRLLWWSTGFVTLALFALLIGTLYRIRQIARAPSSIHETTEGQIATEDARLRQLGLKIRDGHFLNQRPFAPPWTSHSLLLPLDQNSAPQPSVKKWLGVGADLLLADLDVLQPTMQRAYGGWDTAAARGWDWNQWFADWRKQLRARGSATLSYNEAFAPIDALLAFQRDNHTNIPVERVATTDLSQTAILTGAPTAPCRTIRSSSRLFPIANDDAGQQVRGAKMWSSGATNLQDTKYIAMPRSYGTPQAVNCGGTWIPLEPVGEYARHGLSLILRRLRTFHEKDDTLPRLQRIGQGIVYARLPSFSGEYYEGVSTQDWAQHQSGDRVLIVDMRNNSGGDESYGIEMLRGWIDENRLVPFGSLGTELASSCLFPPLKWNSEQIGRMVSLPQERFLQGLLDQMAQHYPPGCPRTVVTTPSKWTYLQRRFSPSPGDMRIVVLLNSGCLSDCELLTMRLASLPESIIVGTNTGGMTQFIQPGYSVLPRTGLRYRFALGHSNNYGDNRSVDGYGLDADVVLPGIDSLDLAQIRQLAEIVAKL